jgi:glucokinase
MPKVALAVDIGATKVALALVDHDFAVHNKKELMIGNSTSDDLWRSITESAGSLIAGLNGNLLGVGIGSAGPLHIEIGAISPVNIPIWRKYPIVEKFRDLSGSDNVVLHGDAMALAHAEHVLGAGRGSENMLGMVVSTGVGGGLIIDNKVFTGDTGNASFIGHQTINFDGELCVCGRNGCVEVYASGPRMVAIAQTRGWSGGNTFVDLAADARKGDEISLTVIDEGARALAIGIINTLGNLDITTVVVGGGVSQAGEIYWGPLRHHVKNESRYSGFLNGIILRPAELHRDAGLIGAALGVLDGNSVLV